MIPASSSAFVKQLRPTKSDQAARGWPIPFYYARHGFIGLFQYVLLGAEYAVGATSGICETGPEGRVSVASVYGPLSVAPKQLLCGRYCQY